MFVLNSWHYYKLQCRIRQLNIFRRSDALPYPERGRRRCRHPCGALATIIIVSCFMHMSIPCPRTNTRRENVTTPSITLGELGRYIVMSRTRHGAFSFIFRSRILRDGCTAQRIPLSGTLKAPLGCSFDPRAEGAMTTARPPL